MTHKDLKIVSLEELNEVEQYLIDLLRFSNKTEQLLSKETEKCLNILLNKIKKL